MSERLTDEQMAEAAEIMRGSIAALPGWRAEPWHERSQIAKVFLYAEQVSADLSAAKDIGKRVADVDAALARASAAESSLSALQEKAREAVEAIDSCDFSYDREPGGWMERADPAVSALRSLLPEEQH